ncbi:ABC transporter permease [Actinotalea fermentans]|uniref:ABC transmembrane type-1 domain-containing protein n=1 Tax=Actinotalea fermentans TaxID=43671 RepID=A0A511YSW8_9CELL|nr:ABC transporter permease subunit [Actinotalea fermentans]KGM16991.1 glycine/betaine ABC transporter [Actinotalea fermentans ATCC 43279 = JCM 9966 = DSM 3133]GEN78294.1 hypothetical protein AFE02nite_00280 [Actinotalea fermentans]
MSPEELGFRIPLGEWIETGVDWVTAAFGLLFDAIRTVLVAAFDATEAVLTGPPWWAVVVVLAALAVWAKGWRLGLGALAGFVVVIGVDQWDNAMASLALVLVASVIALAIGIPLGVWAARNDRVSATVRPVLDFMQTMPAFVYLIPVVVIFRAGVVPGLVATIIFALAPGVRFTELGIRRVDREVVEAGHAFGAPPGRILRQIQMPLAMPTIMAGVNQVIMLSLSMVVISGLAGTRGLGREVVSALSTIDIALGFEAGLAVVILAIYLDRITSALTSRSPVARALATTAAR